MRRLAALFLLAACGGAPPPAEPPEKPERIVSLDLCADQYVLRLADPGQILAVSPQAATADSHMREAAAGVATVRPSVEDVLLLRPDLVVRSYGGGMGAAEALRRAGVPVVEIGWPEGLEEVARTGLRMGRALGHPARGEALAAGMRGSLTKKADTEGESLLYLTPSGVTTGPGSLIDEVLTAAGGRNFVRRPGWHDIPLERLVRDKPDRVVTGFFASKERFEGHWDPMRHPLASDLLSERPRTDLPGSLLACAAWPLAEAAARVAGGEG